MAAASELFEVPLLRYVNASLGIKWSQQDSTVWPSVSLTRSAPALLGAKPTTTEASATHVVGHAERHAGRHAGQAGARPRGVTMASAQADAAGECAAHQGNHTYTYASTERDVDDHVALRLFTDVLSLKERKRAEVLLRHLASVCDANDIPYMMDGGTLIGSMLHHGRIPWDDDFDVYIPFEHQATALKRLRSNGFKVTPGPSMASIPKYAIPAGSYHKLWNKADAKVPNRKAWNWPFIDIGWLKGNATHAWELRAEVVDKWGRRSDGPKQGTPYARHVYPKAWLYPTVLRPYGELVLRAPRNADAILCSRLGSGWRELCAAANWNHRLERVYVANASVRGMHTLKCRQLHARFPFVHRLRPTWTPPSDGGVRVVHLEEHLLSRGRIVHVATFSSDGNFLQKTPARTPAASAYTST